MPLKISVAYKLTATAATEADYTIYTVPGGKRIKLGTFNVTFPIGTDGYLEISFYRGLEKIVPTEGVLVGEGMAYGVEEVEEYISGEKIIMHYKNTHPSAAKYAYILLEGELL